MHDLKNIHTAMHIAHTGNSHFPRAALLDSFPFHSARGVASFSKVRGMDVVCLLTIKTINTMTEGYKRYNI